MAQGFMRIAISRDQQTAPTPADPWATANGQPMETMSMADIAPAAHNNPYQRLQAQLSQPWVQNTPLATPLATGPVNSTPADTYMQQAASTGAEDR